MTMHEWHRFRIEWRSREFNGALAHATDRRPNTAIDSIFL
jgi:hypothetical protein